MSFPGWLRQQERQQPGPRPSGPKLADVLPKVDRAVKTLCGDDGGSTSTNNSSTSNLSDEFVRVEATKGQFQAQVLSGLQAPDMSPSLKAAGSAATADILSGRLATLKGDAEKHRRAGAQHRTDRDAYAKHAKETSTEIENLLRRVATLSDKLRENRADLAAATAATELEDAAARLAEARAAALEGARDGAVHEMARNLALLDALHAKAKTRSLRSFTQEDVQTMLLELNLHQHAAAFLAAEVDGNSLYQITKDSDSFAQLGVADLAEQKRITHACFTVAAAGRVVAPPPLPPPPPTTESGLLFQADLDASLLRFAFYSRQELADWLRRQTDIRLESTAPLEELPAFAVLHLNMKELVALRVGEMRQCASMAQRLEEVRTLLMSVYLSASEDFAEGAPIGREPPASLVCAITGKLMDTPVIERDGLVYEDGVVPSEAQYSPVTNQAMGPRSTLLPQKSGTWLDMITKWKEGR